MNQRLENIYYRSTIPQVATASRWALKVRLHSSECTRLAQRLRVLMGKAEELRINGCDFPSMQLRVNKLKSTAEELQQQVSNYLEAKYHQELMNAKRLDISDAKRRDRAYGIKVNQKHYIQELLGILKNTKSNLAGFRLAILGKKPKHKTHPEVKDAIEKSSYLMPLLNSWQSALLETRFMDLRSATNNAYSTIDLITSRLETRLYMADLGLESQRRREKRGES